MLYPEIDKKDNTALRPGASLVCRNQILDYVQNRAVFPMFVDPQQFCTGLIKLVRSQYSKPGGESKKRFSQR